MLDLHIMLTTIRLVLKILESEAARCESKAAGATPSLRSFFVLSLPFQQQCYGKPIVPNRLSCPDL